ncbi:hypothetical protein U1Q18_003208 [Sarracenia purpurea var. burkii]
MYVTPKYQKRRRRVLAEAETDWMLAEAEATRGDLRWPPSTRQEAVHGAEVRRRRRRGGAEWWRRAMLRCCGGAVERRCSGLRWSGAVADWVLAQVAGRGRSTAVL